LSHNLAVRASAGRAVSSARLLNRYWLGIKPLGIDRVAAAVSAAGLGWRKAQMGEDSHNHRGIFDGGDHLQGAATVRAVFDIEDPFEQLTRLMRAGAPCACA
jgi:hypothetical protein